MHIPVRDMYINILEKRAAEAAIAPDYGIDSQEVANGEVGANNKDQRAQLEPLFAATKATEKATTKQVNQLLPIAKKTPGTSASNPLLKVAHHEAFFSGLRQTNMLKTAELDYLRTAFRGFEDELAKVATLAGSLFKAKGGRQAVESGAKALNPASFAGKGSRAVRPKKMPVGSGARPMPSAPRSTTIADRDRGLASLKKRAPDAISAADSARFSKTPRQVGNNVWKLASLSKDAGKVGAFLKKVIPKKKPAAWGPGMKLKGGLKSKPSTVNFGAF